MDKKITIFWFRRDLRIEDNVGFSEALKSGFPVLPIFIFDKEILDKLPKDDARVNFIFDTLQKMKDFLLKKSKSSIAVYHDNPIQIFEQLHKEYNIQAVYTNKDYEPYAKKRDASIQEFLNNNNIDFKRLYLKKMIF